MKNRVATLILSVLIVVLPFMMVNALILVFTPVVEFYEDFFSRKEEFVMVEKVPVTYETNELNATVLTADIIEREDVIIIGEQEPAPEATETPNIEAMYALEIEYLAKTAWGEAGSLDKTQWAAVIWCILNRVDSDIGYMPDDIISVVTQPNQFTGYKDYHPVTDEMRELVVDILGRWEAEKNGATDVGRVLPAEYLYFTSVSNGRINFEAEWKSGVFWDWSWGSPY